MNIIVVFAFLLFVTVIILGVYKWVTPLFSSLSIDEGSNLLALDDTVDRLGIKINQGFGEIDAVHLGRVVLKVNAALGTRQNRDCLVVTTVRGKIGHLKTTICFDLKDAQNQESTALTDVLEHIIHCAEDNCGSEAQSDGNILIKAAKLSWRTMGFSVPKVLGTVQFPGLLAGRYFKALGSSEFVTTAPATNLYAYIGERQGVKFLLAQTGRYENTVGNIETAQRIDIVIPIKALQIMLGLLAAHA